VRGTVAETKVYGRRRALDIVTPLGAVVALAVLVICVFLAVRCHLAARNQHLGALPLAGEPLGAGQACPGGSGGQWGAAGALDGLKLNTVISSGRYGEVWKGVLNDVTVSSTKDFCVSHTPRHTPVFLYIVDK
jgi:hypothetical protein